MVENLNAQTKIRVNNFPDSVRENPDVYISGSNPALSCFSEILANSVDECKAGYCNHIIVVVDKNNNIMVKDNGRGIPIAPCDDPMHKGFSQCEVALSSLSSSGKFLGDDDSSGYKEATGGKNGMGSACVNAMSEFFICEVEANGSLYQIKFNKGVFTQRQKIIKQIDKSLHGTTIKYHLDPSMFDSIETDLAKVVEMCQQMAFLNNKLKIQVAVQKQDESWDKYEFAYDDGLKSYLDLLCEKKSLAIESKIHLSRTVPAKELPRDLAFDISFAYGKSENQEIKSFVNSIPSENGGSHVQGFNQGLCNALRKYGVETKAIKNPADFEIGDCSGGAFGIVALRYKKPTFDRQSKTKLDMPKVRTIIAHELGDEFYDFLEKNPKEAKVILDMALLSRKERLAIKAARERVRNNKQNPKGLTLGKLTDCTSKNPEECELFLVEGDSAGGSCKTARNHKTQAILPIFGKIPNVIKDPKSIAQIFADKLRLGVVVAALGCGIGETFDITKLKYHKIMPFSDADVDGAHIQVLWICFFYKYFPKIIEEGYLYLPQPPLFRATKNKQKTKWFYTSKELNEANLDKSWDVSRFKGLGEMDPDQLWDTSMNPKNRILRRVTMKDAELAYNAIMLCMGGEVKPRREFIMNEAEFIEG